MRYLLSICAMTFLAATVFAQPSKKVETWQVFSPASDDFSVETPLTLSQIGNGPQTHSRRFSGTINGVYLFVFSEPIEKQNKMEHGYLEMVRNTLPKIGGPTELTIPQNEGSETLSFKDTYGYWHSLRLVRTKSRFYVVQGWAQDESNEVVNRFVASFMPGQKLPTSPDFPLSGQIVDMRTSQGSQPVAGNLPATPMVTPPVNSPLKVTGKPRPGYTDFARTYGIQGTVVLEVEFLASGEIGTVKALTQLPMGLTETALAAGKSITFQPATENGVPVSVTKKIEYSYAIY